MLCYMAIIAITSSSLKNARRYVEVMESTGAEVRVLIPDDYSGSCTSQLMRDVGGLLICGGPDIDPVLYGEEPDPDAGLVLNRPLDDFELLILQYALDLDLSLIHN